MTNSTVHQLGRVSKWHSLVYTFRNMFLIDTQQVIRARTVPYSCTQ